MLSLVESAGLCAMLGIMGFWALLAMKPTVRGTTLLAAWWWALFSLVAVTATEMLRPFWSGGAAASWGEPARFAAAMTTFCPIVAILGAKRPQHLAWQFVVQALWITLCVPAIGWYLAGEIGLVRPHPAYAWFLVILLATGVLNYLPTKFALPSLLCGGGQLVLLSPYLPIEVPSWAQSWSSSTALALAAIGGFVAIRRAKAPLKTTTEWDCLWLDFRDLFGAVWALRVAERWNALAKIHAWQAMLHWNGFAQIDSQKQGRGDPLADCLAADNFKSLLHRFVSPEWIAEHQRSVALSGEPPASAGGGAPE